MEEKLLVDIDMRKWFASAKLQDLCVPTFIFKVVEERIIEKFKRKEKHGGSSYRRRNDL